MCCHFSPLQKPSLCSASPPSHHLLPPLLLQLFPVLFSHSLLDILQSSCCPHLSTEATLVTSVLQVINPVPESQTSLCFGTTLNSPQSPFFSVCVISPSLHGHCFMGTCTRSLSCFSSLFIAVVTPSSCMVCKTVCMLRTSVLSIAM